VHDLKKAHDAGASVARIATHCTEADVSIQHFGAARDLGMETVGFLMLSHKVSPEKLAEQARIMVDAGAQCVYVVDSAGALVLTDARSGSRRSSTRSGRRPRSASTATRTSAWASPTRCSPTRPGRKQIDGALCALGAGAGNSPTEVLAATFERLGIRPASTSTRCSPPPRTSCARSSRDCRGWTAVDHPGLRRGLQLLPLHAERAAERYDVPAHAILQKVGEYGYVGGQEDMIIDVALELPKRRGVDLGDLAIGRALMTAAPEGDGTSSPSPPSCWRCEDERRDRVKFTDEWPELDVETGYRIQDLNLRQAPRARREADRRQAGPDQPRQAAADGRRHPVRRVADRRDDPAGR
jgi:4-hydroxy 2-oxovalerate aldolase